MAREQYISQKEKEEIDSEKKKDAELLLKQAKDAYFSKINSSFSVNKVRQFTKLGLLLGKYKHFSGLAQTLIIFTLANRLYAA